jgi:hypothetical protein
MFVVTSALIGFLATTAVVPAVEVVEPDPKKMSQAEIRAFNASLDKNHKFYIRCKRSIATGSLAKREYSCRTNAQWAAADARGNQEARDIMDEMSSKSWNTSGG